LALSRGRRRGVRAGTLGITPSPGRASPVGEWIIKGAAARTPDPEGRHRRSAIRNPSAARPPAPPKPSACPLARMTERPVLVARRRMPSGAVVVPYPHDRGGRSRPGRCQGIGMSSHPGAQSQHPARANPSFRNFGLLRRSGLDAQPITAERSAFVPRIGSLFQDHLAQRRQPDPARSDPVRPRDARNLSGSIGSMSDGMAVIAVMWARRRGGSTRYGADTPADRRADAGTAPAAGNCADDSSGSGSEQTTADRAIGGIVRVRGGRRREQQSSADYAGDSRLLSHEPDPLCTAENT
jgi:hypothetical protein